MRGYVSIRAHISYKTARTDTRSLLEQELIQFS